MINLNGSNAKELYYGSTPIGSAYLGDDMVYHRYGTYTDILWSAADHGAGRLGGTLSKSIYDYDMIKVFPMHDSNNELSIASMYCPNNFRYGLSSDAMSHIFSIAGQGNIYFVDQILKWTNSGTKFSAYPINANSASCRGTNNTVSGTTAKNWAAFNNYNKGHCGIGMIMGVNYYGNRELLYSASDADLLALGSGNQVVNLSKPYSAFEKVQIRMGRTVSTVSNWEKSREYWTELYNFPDNMRGYRPRFLLGGGGACYNGERSYKFITPTQLSGGPAKSFIWYINSTAAPIATTANAYGNAIQEVWGIKDA